MTFLIKQISRTSSGQEIIRPTELDRTRLTIGRAAGSDIHLQDLAVTPQHATIERIDTRRILVKAAGTLGFGVDGRTVTQVEIDSTKGAELRFGSHRLTVAHEGESITIAVERVEALSEASQDKDEQKVFSLRGLMPAKRSSAWGFAVLVLIAFLAFPIWSYASSRGEKIRPDQFHADSSWSSGSLSKAHATLKDDCQSCHVDAFVAVRDDACVACHTSSHDAKNKGPKGAAMKSASFAAGGDDDRTGPTAYDHAPTETMIASVPQPGLGGQITGFFKSTFNIPQGRCVECHTEHEGAGPMAETAQAFCSDCHTGLGARLRSAGLKSDIADASDFGLNHPQLKPSVLAGYNFSLPTTSPLRDVRQGGNPLMGWATKRISLDKPQRQEGGLKFTHGQHLDGRNGVAQMWRRIASKPAMDCADCHRTDPTGTRYLPVDMETSCQSCHSLGIETVGGTVRQLPHGQPDQVIADIRAFYGSAGGFRPSGLPMARYTFSTRRRPGEVNAERRVDDVSRGRMVQSGAANDLIRATFGPRGVCGECHQVSFSGPSGVTIAPVAQPTRYLHKGWFDHRPHIGLATRNAKGGSTIWGCKDCHTAATTSNDANVLMLPSLSTCQACHTGESGKTNAKLVMAPTKSSCALCHSYHADDGAPWVSRQRVAKQMGDTNLLASRQSGR